MHIQFTWYLYVQFWTVRIDLSVHNGGSVIIV